MKIPAVICKIVLFGFTCLVLVTDGVPREAGYIIATLLVMSVPIFCAVTIFRSGVSDGWLRLDTKEKALKQNRKINDLSSMSTTMDIAAIVSNFISFESSAGPS